MVDTRRSLVAHNDNFHSTIKRLWIKKATDLGVSGFMLRIMA